MKPLFLILALAPCLLFVGCGHDDLVGSSRTTDYSGVTVPVEKAKDEVRKAKKVSDDIVSKGTAAHSPEAIQLQLHIKAITMELNAATDALDKAKADNAEQIKRANDLQEKLQKQNDALRAAAVKAKLWASLLLWGGCTCALLGYFSSFLYAPLAVIPAPIRAVIVTAAAWVIFLIVTSIWSIFGWIIHLIL